MWASVCMGVCVGVGVSVKVGESDEFWVVCILFYNGEKDKELIEEIFNFSR